MNRAGEQAKGFRIADRKWLSDRVLSMWVEAPLAAQSWRPGQFVVVRPEEGGGHLPAGVAEVNRDRTRLRLVVPLTAWSRRFLDILPSVDRLADVIGPAGKPAVVTKLQGPVLGVAEEVGAAFLLPHLAAHREAGNKISVILGASTLKELILVDEIQKVAHDLHMTTGDGTFVHKGPVSDLLIDLLNRGFKPALIIAAGPPGTMRETAEIASRRKITVTVSINPVLVDGLGGCAGCRLSVGSNICYACVDGPDFDGTQVGWEDLMRRVDQSIEHEAFLWDESCKIIGAGDPAGARVQQQH